LKHVVIVGGGFAGLSCARQLARSDSLRITLIDKNNYQQFQPLLYQVATGALATSNVAFNLRNILRNHSNVNVKMAEVVSVDLHTRTAVTAEGQKYLQFSTALSRQISIGAVTRKKNLHQWTWRVRNKRYLEPRTRRPAGLRTI